MAPRIIDVLLLLPNEDAATHTIKCLLRNVPKFQITTPIPYFPSELTQLHRENMSSISSYLCRNNFGVPSNIIDMSVRPLHLSALQNELLPTMTNSNIFYKLKRLLHIFHLTLVPADKTNMLVILPTTVLKEELQLHLSDHETYNLLNPETAEQYNTQQQHTVTEAATFYKESKLLNNSPSTRYIYLLPKVHKPEHQWRTPYHPKMRPIICDSNSTTNRLAKYMLPMLQKLERSLESTATSSLAVAYDIEWLNKTHHHLISTNTKLATVDVDSLFTRIPQDQLLDIVSHLFTEEHLLQGEELLKFIHFLKIIIKHNTFKVNEDTYLQQIGLPMGGPLSGTLANIYLGFLERQTYLQTNIALYKRYMDDIIIVANMTSQQLEDFLQTLRQTFNLAITANYNQSSVNFLDTTITVDHAQQSLDIWPYSKNYTCYPIPSQQSKKQLQQNVNMVKSQILRTWRFSTSDQQFSKSVNHYLTFLTSQTQHRHIRRQIFKFLHPVKTTTHQWTTSIPLCEECHRINKAKEIHICKIMKVNQKYFATKMPVNCSTEQIHAIVKSPNHDTKLMEIPSLHNFIHSDICQRRSFVTPLGQLSSACLQRLFEKGSFTIEQTNSIKTPTKLCYTHEIFRNQYSIYGVQTLNKRKKKIDNYLNSYKKIGRRQ